MKYIYPGSPFVSWLTATGGECSFTSILLSLHKLLQNYKGQNLPKMTRVLRLSYFAGFYALRKNSFAN